MSTCRPLAFLAPSFLALTLSAAGQSMNFDMEPVAGAVQPQATWGGAAGSPGIWNHVLGSQGFYGGPFIDVFNQATPVDIRISNGTSGRCGVGCVGANPAGSNQEALLDDYCRFNGNLTVQFDNLIAGTYDVYVYGWAPDNAQARTTVYTQHLGGAWPANNNMVQNTHWARKQGVVVPAGTSLTIHMAVNVSVGTLNGIQLVQTSTSIGTSACHSMPNSSGQPARMVAVGSQSALENFFFVGCANMPQNSFCVFFTSQTPTMAPLSSGLGYLCIGGSAARGVGGQIFNSGSDGFVLTQADLSMHPTPTGPTTVLPGDTWYFQCMMRETFGGTATFTSSDAVEVPFF